MGSRKSSKTYLSKNHHGYCFRIKIPEDLQSYIGKKELRYSLKTQFFLEAQEMAEKLADNVKEIFATIRHGRIIQNLSDNELLPIVNEWWQAFSTLLEGLRIKCWNVPHFKKASVDHTDTSPPSKTALISPTLSEVARDFMNWGVTVEKWKPRSQTGFQQCLDDMLDFLGHDRMIHTITDRDIVGYRDAIYKRKLSTQRNIFFMGRANMFFRFAIEEKRLLPRGHENPVTGLIPKAKKNGKAQCRKPFDADDLKKLFHSTEYLNGTHEKPYQFWLPVLALYTGARIEELCQLYVSDIKQLSGVWCLDINEDRPDKSVKNGEQRLVPLHPVITDELNFIGYVKGLKNQLGRVFPGLKRIGNKYGHYPSRWFASYKNKCGIDPAPNKKVFHSFRMTMISHLTAKGVPLYQIKQVVGHSDVSDVTMNHYSEPLKPNVLMNQVVMNLDYDFNFSLLASANVADDVFPT